MADSESNRAPSALVEWFAVKRRDLPWRTLRDQPRDPWQTLVSEVMSQQTRLEVVIPRFRDWMRQFPHASDLAEASEPVVLAAWAGLGYYSRARNLHRAAKAIATSGWPSDHAGFLQLPGVGPYTAAALASLYRMQSVAMVDGNVLRVLARVFAQGQDLRTGAGKRRLDALAQSWIEGGNAGEINEATMELGALVCTPRAPRCGECPLADTCLACRRGEPEAYPVKKIRTPIVVVERDVVVAIRDGCVLLRPTRPDELLRELLVLPYLGEVPLEGMAKGCGVVRHAITHHKIAWKVHHGSADIFRLPEGWVEVPPCQLPECVVSSLVRKALVKAGVWPA